MWPVEQTQKIGQKVLDAMYDEAVSINRDDGTYRSMDGRTYMPFECLAAQTFKIMCG